MALCHVQLFGCKMNKVDLAADKFTEDAGSRMTEFTINPAKGTAEMRKVGDGLAPASVYVFAVFNMQLPAPVDMVSGVGLVFNLCVLCHAVLMLVLCHAVSVL